jgi:hypothetical protein
MRSRVFILTILSAVVSIVLFTAGEAEAQRGGGGKGVGKGGGGRAAGHGAPKQSHQAHAGPAMTRPSGPSQGRGNVGGAPNRGKQGGATEHARVGAAGSAKPNAGFQRPTAGNHEGPKLGGGSPNIPGNQRLVATVRASQVRRTVPLWQRPGRRLPRPN